MGNLTRIKDNFATLYFEMRTNIAIRHTKFTRIQQRHDYCRVELRNRLLCTTTT